jgi:hypothetical protein
MCRRLVLALLFSLSLSCCLSDARAASAASAAASAASAAYNPQVEYPGSYPAKVLYKKSRPKSHWSKAIVNVDADTLLCPEAKQALNTAGYWHGTLLANGTCVVSESSDWTSGNWLNYLKTPR